MELGAIDERIGLIDGRHEGGVQFVTLLSQSDDVVDGVLDLRNHVLSTLVLVILQIGLNRIQCAYLLVEGDQLLGICDRLHEVGMTADVSDRLKQVLALLHYKTVRLNAALLGLAGRWGLDLAISRGGYRGSHFTLKGASLREVITRAAVNR